MSRLRVTEVYTSVQGESTHAGRLCTFIRLTGCNLRCAWCDSEYTFTGGEWWSIDRIMSTVKEMGVPLVQITGGEPLLQEDCYTLMNALVDEGYEVLLETSGSISLVEIPPPVKTIMDLKAPSSGEMSKNLWENLDLLQEHDEVKIVIASHLDYEWAREVASEYPATYLFSPAWGIVEPADLAAWMMKDKVSARMQVQLHKILWPDQDRGV